MELKRVPMLKRAELKPAACPKLIAHPAKASGANGFLVSVVGGPYHLLWRATKEQALADGMIFAKTTYPELFK